MAAPSDSPNWWVPETRACARASGTRSDTVTVHNAFFFFGSPATPWPCARRRLGAHPRSRELRATGGDFESLRASCARAGEKRPRAVFSSISIEVDPASAHQSRRYPRAAWTNVHTLPLAALQGVSHRRGAHSCRPKLVQSPAQKPGRARPSAREVSLHWPPDRSAEPLSESPCCRGVPAIQPQAVVRRQAPSASRLNTLPGQRKLDSNRPCEGLAWPTRGRNAAGAMG